MNIRKTIMMKGIIFLVISTIVLNGTAIIIPKKITRIEMVSTIMFALLFEIVVDIILDLKYDLYGYFQKGLDLETFGVVFMVYPASNVIILNYFPFNSKIKYKILYVLGVSLCCLIFEYLSVESGYFYYRVWKLWYSALCYPLIISILGLFCYMIRKVVRSEYTQT